MNSNSFENIITIALSDDLITDEQALALADCDDAQLLLGAASQLRDKGFHNVVTYSKKSFSR